MLIIKLNNFVCSFTAAFFVLSLFTSTHFFGRNSNLLRAQLTHAIMHVHYKATANGEVEYGNYGCKQALHGTKVGQLAKVK